MVILLCVFFILRGRIKVEHGLSGKLIERFNTVERFAHWLTATSFVVLAVTGLNVLYGRYALLPLIGPDAFSVITIAGKYLHNYLAFAFMVGVVMMFVMWVGHNIPNRLDLVWLAKAGGLFTKGVHPPAKKFNAGQKLIFWSVILGGASISISGVALLFPFELQMFGKTFAFINLFGTDLPTQLTVMQEMQLSQLWHGIVGIGLIVVIIAHIYIGSTPWAAARSMKTGRRSTTASGSRKSRHARPRPGPTRRDGRDPSCDGGAAALHIFYRARSLAGSRLSFLPR